MIGVLFKLITAAFPFIKEMLFARSATGRTRMISFLIICNLAIALSFFATAKVTTSLYIAEKKHREDIKQLKLDLEKANEIVSTTKRTNTSVLEITEMYSASLNVVRAENHALHLENVKLQAEVSYYATLCPKAKNKK